jgi:3-oxoacyl-[acyl-carrier protein] reductase
VSTALILGASGVLGNAVAEAFRGKGFQVSGTGHKQAPNFQPSIQLDATQAEEVKKLGKWLDEEKISVDVAVHCIGINRDNLIAKMEEAEWTEVMETNLKSAFLLSKLLVARFVKQRKGHLIFIGSWGGLVGRAGQANYAAAKAGLIALSKSIAQEYASRGILSNVIIPGVFKSRITENLSAAELEKLWTAAAIKQFADPVKMAEFVVHLSEMKGVTGQVFQLDSRIGG